MNGNGPTSVGGVVTGVSPTQVGVIGQAGGQAIGVEGISNTGPQLRLRPNSRAMPPSDGSWVAGSMLSDQNNELWYCFEDGAGPASGWWPISLVPAFIPLPSPVRMYDSRAGLDPVGVQKGTLGNNIDRNIDSTVNGAAPVTAFTVLINLTVVNTSAVGWMSVRQAGAPYFGHTNITWYARVRSSATP